MWPKSRNFQINEESKFFVQTFYTQFTTNSMFEASEVTRNNDYEKIWPFHQYS